MSAKILVVEDEEPLALLLQYNLESEGFSVDLIHHGDDVELNLEENRPNLIILDWMLPGVSGLELCRRIRANGKTSKIPIILLTARGEESDRVRGLATGADDYVTKPFSVPELIARVNAVLRRANPKSIADTLTVGDLEMDRTSFRVKRGPREVRLGPTEFRLLEFLMQSPGRVYSRGQLLDSVWGQNVYVDERTVDVHIGRLRKALNRGQRNRPYQNGARSRLFHFYTNRRCLTKSVPRRASHGYEGTLLGSFFRPVHQVVNKSDMHFDKILAFYKSFLTIRDRKTYETLFKTHLSHYGSCQLDDSQFAPVPGHIKRGWQNHALKVNRKRMGQTADKRTIPRAAQRRYRARLYQPVK